MNNLIVFPLTLTLMLLYWSLMYWIGKKRIRVPSIKIKVNIFKNLLFFLFLFSMGISKENKVLIYYDKEKGEKTIWYGDNLEVEDITTDNTF